MGSMPLYRERLWPAPWMYIATALVIPASLLVFVPINQTAGVVVAIVLYAGCVTLMLLAAPSLTVTATEFVAGKARIPIGLVGAVTAHREADARQQRGPGLDARAWLLIRGWIDPVVRVPIDDPADPTPYWIVSTRQPEKLAAALTTAKAEASGSAGR